MTVDKRRDAVYDLLLQHIYVDDSGYLVGMKEAADAIVAALKRKSAVDGYEQAEQDNRD